MENGQQVPLESFKRPRVSFLVKNIETVAILGGPVVWFWTSSWSRLVSLRARRTEDSAQSLIELMRRVSDLQFQLFGLDLALGHQLPEPSDHLVADKASAAAGAQSKRRVTGLSWDARGQDTSKH